MTTTPTTTVMHPLRMRVLEVVSVERPTPRLVRVALGGDDIDGFRSDGPADHVKLFFPAPGRTVPDVPEIGPNGLVVRDGAPRPRGRDYTPRHDLLEDGLLLIDVVLHERGIGSDWARRAEIGDRIGVAGPRGSHVLEGRFDGFVLVGDETALPAMRNFARCSRRGQVVRAYVEVADADDIEAIAGAGDIDVTWLSRDGLAPGHSSVLVDALADGSLPTGRVFHWVAGEADIARTIRSCLVEDHGVDPAMIESRGYWKLGAEDHQEPHAD